ncbi:hypothetical protein ACRDNQ_01875 [Palleronia sp. KMU-117]|uniref:hypothetical protein n=1 Tax=Palleronia sp. KMU-117 TaxID=3434108 RepID=UPI003D752149
MSGLPRDFGAFVEGRLGDAGQTALSAALCAGLCLLSSAAVAQTSFEDERERLIAAIEAAGCIVHEGNHEAILREARMTPAQGSLVVTFLMDTGQAEPLGDDLRLTTGNCP